MKSVDKKVGIKSFSDPTQGAVPSFFTSPIWEDKSSLSFKLKQIIFQAVLEVAGKNQGLKSDILKLEHPSQNNYGDYATNIALILAGKMHLKPYDLAKKIADQLNKYISDNQKITISSDSKKSQDNNIYPSRILEKIEIGGGGFINLWLREDYLITLL
ncbi:hypothetical protein FJY90_08140, partial [Candidatus Gottesmanbacteria bacterium]|nr:hypothetical protein [Candidatus Gottesmanbacteria bacterium]